MQAHVNPKLLISLPPFLAWQKFWIDDSWLGARNLSVHYASIFRGGRRTLRTPFLESCVSASKSRNNRCTPSKNIIRNAFPHS